jgi:hypothetical protein
MKNRSSNNKAFTGTTPRSTSSSSRKNGRGYSFGFGALFCVTITLTIFLMWSRMHFFTSLIKQVNEPQVKPAEKTTQVIISTVPYRNNKLLREKKEDVVDHHTSNINIQATTKEVKTTKTAVISKSKDSNSHNSHNKKNEHAPKKLKIAFAITMNHDGNFQDGAAVLAYSIYATNMTKRHDVSFVAFVHPNVVTSRPVLAKIGYHVIEAPTPIK